MARALELVLRLQPVGRAAQVGADGDQGEELVLLVDDPDAVRFLEALVHDSGREVVGRSHLEAGGRLEEDVGEHEAAEGGHAAADGGGEADPGDRRPGEEAAAADLGAGGGGGRLPGRRRGGLLGGFGRRGLYARSLLAGRPGGRALGLLVGHAETPGMVPS